MPRQLYKSEGLRGLDLLWVRLGSNSVREEKGKFDGLEGGKEFISVKWICWGRPNNTHWIGRW